MGSKVKLANAHGISVKMADATVLYILEFLCRTRVFIAGGRFRIATHSVIYTDKSGALPWCDVKFTRSDV